MLESRLTSGGGIPSRSDIANLIAAVVHSSPQGYVVSTTDVSSRVWLAAHRYWPFHDRVQLESQVESAVAEVSRDRALCESLGLRIVVTPGLFDGNGKPAHVFVSVDRRPDLYTPARIHLAAKAVLDGLGARRERGDLLERAVAHVVLSMPGWELVARKEFPDLMRLNRDLDVVAMVVDRVVVLECKNFRAEMINHLGEGRKRAEELRHLGVPMWIVAPGSTERGKGEMRELGGGVIETMCYLVRDESARQALEAELGTPWPTGVLASDGSPPTPMHEAIAVGLRRIGAEVAAQPMPARPLGRRETDGSDTADLEHPDPGSLARYAGRLRDAVRMDRSERLLRDAPSSGEEASVCCGCGAEMEPIVRLGVVVEEHVCRNLACLMAGVSQSPTRWNMRSVAREVIGIERIERIERIEEGEQSKELADRAALRSLQRSYEKYGQRSSAAIGRQLRPRTWCMAGKCRWIGDHRVSLTGTC